VQEELFFFKPTCAIAVIVIHICLPSILSKTQKVENWVSWY